MAESKKPIQKAEAISSGKSELKGIIRIAEMDLKGEKLLKMELPKIKGVGINLSLAIMRALGLNLQMKTGELTEEQVKKIEEAINDPIKFGIPAHMVNRKDDPVTGESHNVVSSKLIIERKMDIDNMKKMRCYKGIRHELGQPVRGQRTRGSFRTGTKVGVIKKKQMPGAASKPAAEKK